MKEILIYILLATILSLNNIYGQDKKPVRIYLEHFKNDEIHQLSIRVLTKNDKKYRPAEGVEVDLYASNISSANLLGTLLTTNDGTNIYTFNKEQYEKAENEKIATYYAVIQINDSIQSKEVEITIKDVNLDVRFVVEDSVKQLHVRVTKTDSIGIDIPQEDVEIKFLVDRPLNPLPIGGDFNTTDENGRVYIDFPNDLPGDEEGFLKVFVRIIENEDYGTVEISEVRQWGIPLIISNDTLKRSLWASGSNAPISLIILINGVILVIWMILFFIVYKIFQIRKLGVK
jgi:5-hydroxyisourate hydrolase-like protein (transthyretin family)